MQRTLIIAGIIAAAAIVILANAFYIVVERGNVYIMGRVTEREASRATDIARGVRGVQKVVRAMEIISEAELAAMGQSQQQTKPKSEQ